jgi:hypothetical protein
MTSAAVDPTNLPQRMSRPQLEWWILFGICVAGKSAKGTEKKVQAFMEFPYTNMGSNKPMSPFERVRFMIRHKKLAVALKHVRMGKYALFNKAFRAAVNIDLDNISVESLEKIPGIGPKTARMTAMYGFPDTAGEVAVLDTHILKWLRLKGYDAPKSTPQAGRRYLQLEQAFIAEAKKQGKTARELDTEIWQSYTANPVFTDNPILTNPIS